MKQISVDAVVKRYNEYKAVFDANEGHASLYVGTDFQQKEEDFDLTSRRNTHDFAAHGGAFPLLLPSGLVFGVTAVSGLPSIYDHSLVTATLKEFVSAQ